MKKSLKSIFAFASCAVVALAMSSCGLEDPVAPKSWETEKVFEDAIEVNWNENEIPVELLKVAKPGAKLHVEASNLQKGSEDYCKIYVMSQWNDSGIKEAYFEGNENANHLQVQLKDTNAEGEFDCYRTFFGMSESDGAEGEFYFVLTEESLTKPLFISGFGNVKSCYIEYVNGKKTVSAPTPVTISSPCAEYTTELTKDVDGSTLGYLLQFDNPTENASGPQVTVSGLMLNVTIDGTTVEYSLPTMTIAPDPYADPAYSKSSCRVSIGLPAGTIETGTSVTVQVKEAVVSDSALVDSIICALQEDAAPYGIVGPIWQSAFASEAK